MKQFCLLAFLSLLCATVMAQSQVVEFKSKEDYKKHEASVLDICNGLLSTAVNENEDWRAHNIQVILKWMEGTPDYSFELGQDFVNFTEGNKDELIPVYLASLVKVALEGDQLKGADIITQGREVFLDYCANKENRIKINRNIKKALKARKKG